MKHAAIALENVSFTYFGSSQPVLTDLTCEIPYGALTVISGASGEGKTTLLSILNGSIPRVTDGTLTGTIWLDGQDSRELSMGAISHYIGSVLQNAEDQIIHSRVEDEVAFGCENMAVPADEIQERVAKALERMELGADWATETLSGGQKQRLITATTLAMGQKIVLLDEPLANLDLDGSLQLLTVLKDLAAEGYAVLLVEHRLDVTLPFASRLLWLQDGRLTAYDDPAATFSHVEQVIPRADRLEGTKEQIPLFVLKDVSCEIGGAYSRFD
ncbi:MAG: ABC transporter ATP-binding protein [Lachnospiraceae bacterium]